MKQWEKLENYIVEKLKVLDNFVQRTPGSGNGNRKGDVCFSSNIGLHIEAKQRNKKNVWDVEWFKKCSEEIALHSKKFPIVVTENKDGKRFVHLDADDFFDIYIDAYYWRNPGSNQGT